MDIFDNQILCKKCNRVMKPTLISKNGFNLRTIRCEKCNEIIVHPVDKAEYGEFMRLKNKEFEVKMRMVGNSYAISIPKEIVNFMHEQENMMDNMVKLCFDNANRLSLMFNTPENAENANNNHQRVVSSKEVRVVRNNKPVMHVKQVYDSANPHNNRSIRIIKNKASREQEEEMEED